MRPVLWFVVALAASPITALRAADGPQEKAKKAEGPRAPADYEIVDEDRVGAYFVARPLKQKYDALLARVAVLKAEIADAKIDGAKARGEIARIGDELESLRREIDRTRLYIPGAPVHTATATEAFPLAADDLLLVDAADVAIRGWDRPEVRLLVAKTVLGAGDKAVADDFAGIVVEHRRAPAREFLGYYEGMGTRKGSEAEWQRFPFKEFLGRDITYVSLKGLTAQEGNAYVRLEMKNEHGQGTTASRPRRNARLTLYVPKCRRVGVRGALGGLDVRGLDAPLSILGEGDRDYATLYEVADLGGPLVADNIPIHRLDGIRGDVSIVATADAENVGTAHGPDGVTMRSYGPRPSSYRHLRGDLRARFCRADLTLQGIAGRVDVENDFGATTWLVDLPLARADHRLISQSGPIEIRLAMGGLGGLDANLFSEAGAVHFPKSDRGFSPRNFTSAEGDTARRSWHGFVASPEGRRGQVGGFELYERVAEALHGRPRTPGLDVLSRAGTITLIGND